MGHKAYETFNPDELDLPNDTDFELEGIDEAWEHYQEYEVYIPDKITELKPLSQEAIDACTTANNVIAQTKNHLIANNTATAIAWLLLYDEAVSTTQAENYPVTCASLLQYNARTQGHSLYTSHSGEAAALDAVNALQEFITLEHNETTLDDICSINEKFSRTSPRAHECGILRDKPVWIGQTLFDAEFVPPPADTLDEYMDDLIKFINSKQEMPAIAKAAIAHAQFVTVHPFSDGNGRTGRALAQRMLLQDNVTNGTILPTTSAIVTDKSNYIRALRCMQQSYQTSDPSEFVTFFAHCCEGAAYQAIIMENNINHMFHDWSKLVPANDQTTRKLMEEFAKCPVMTETMASQAIAHDAKTAISTLIDAGIIVPNTSRAYHIPVYTAERALTILENAQTMHSMSHQTAHDIANEIDHTARIREKLENPAPTIRTPIQASTTFNTATHTDNEYA